MKLTVLVDNNTLIDKYYLGEPGVSYLIETEDKQILFDVGYTNAFLTNAQKLGLNLLNTDFIVLSHGHLDHTWGLDPLVKLFFEAKNTGLARKDPLLVAHPDVFNTKTVAGLEEIGSTFSAEKLAKHFKLKLTDQPFWITDKLVFLSQIERKNDFENKSPVGQVIKDSNPIDDYLLEDSALAYKTEQGLVIITGCSHAGICNIIEHAKKVCGDDRIVDVIGGFHLLMPEKAQLEGTLNYFSQLQANTLHPCHCVDLQSKIALANVTKIEEVGVGLVLKY